MKKLYSLFAAVVMAVAVNAQTTKSVTINVSSIGGTDVLKTSNYDGGEERQWSSDDISFGGKAITSNSNKQPNSESAAGTLIQMQASNGVIYNTTALPGRLVSVTLNYVGSAKESTLWGGNESRLVNDVKANYIVNGGVQIGSASTSGWTSSDLENTTYTYFAIKKGSGASYFSSIEIIYEEDIPSVTPALTVDQDALEFPQTLVGSTSEAQTLTVTGENLDAVPTYELSGADASEFAVSGTLTAEGGALSVSFNPTTAGTKTATLTVTSGLLTQTVTLSGEGKALPVLTVDTDSLEFPETVVGQTSTEKIVEVDWANVSGFPTYNITGENADAFNIVDSELKVDETGGYLYIVFEPTTAGAKTATLTLAIDGITKTVALSGTAVEDASLAVGDISTVNTKLVKNTLVDNALVFSANAEVKIYNFSGQLLKTARVSENTAVDVAGFAKGIYVVTGIVDGKAISQKIIKK